MMSETGFRCCALPKGASGTVTAIWSIPPVGAELSGVFATTDSSFNNDSTWNGWGDVPQAGGVVQSLVALTPNGNPAGNDDGTQLAQILSDRQVLGNALMLIQAMVDHQKNGNLLNDFNLDGDRGYGFCAGRSKAIRHQIFQTRC